MRPLVTLAIVLVVGTWVGTEAGLSSNAAAVLVVWGAGLLVIAARLGWHEHARLAVVVACAGVASWGVGRGARADAEAWAPRGVDLAALESAVSAGDPVRIGGVITRDAWLTSSGDVALDLRVEQIRAGPRTQRTALGVRLIVGGVASPERLTDWTRGRWLETPVGTMRRPLPYRNFDTGDAERSRARQGVRLTASSKSAALVDVWPGPWWDERAASARAALRTLVHRHVRDPVASGIVTAILIGDRTSIPADVTLRLQQAGVYHVVAISGGNVALWLAVLLVLPRLTTGFGRGHVAWLLSGLVVFGAIVDGGASVARALVAAIVVVLARWWDIRVRAGQALAAAALWQAATQPLVVHDVGAMLSFGAAITLAWAALVVRHRRAVASVHGAARSRWRTVLAWGAMPVMLTAAIDVTLLPVGASWFSLATAAGLAANVLALPAMAVVQLGGLLLVATAWLNGRLGDLFGVVTSTAVGALLRSGDVVRLAPWLVREVPSPSPIAVAVAYASMAGVAWGLANPAHGHRAMAPAWRMARAWTPRACGAVLAGCVGWMAHGGLERHGPAPWSWPSAEAWQRASWPHEPWLVITHLDVGQGDATVLRLPSGRTWLIDAGGSVSDTFDVGERVTSRALWALGHRRLDRIVLTHAHPDHAAGLPAVIRRLGARELLVGPSVPGEAVDEAVLAAAALADMPVRSLASGEWFVDERVRITVLHPERPEWERRRVRNDDSVVLWIRMGDVGVLLPGDVSGAVERAWLPHMSAARTTVLKLAHHGSASSTSEELLRTLKPVLAVASAGRGNRFGHPAVAVQQRLEKGRIPLFRTDQDGAIQIATNGRVVLVRTATGRYGAFGPPRRRGAM